MTSVASSIHSNPHSILVTGAKGWIGRRTCQELQRLGHRVVAIDLGAESPGPWTTYIEGNIGEDGLLNLATDPRLVGLAGLIHCAGYAHRPIETPLEVERFFAINRDGSRRVIELAKAVGINRVVYVSSIAFYKWGSAEPSTEDSPLDATTAYAQSKLAGEQIFIESGLDWRSVRLATVFGEGDRANFAKLAAALKAGRFVIPGKGSAKKSVLPVDLAARTLARLVLEPVPKHRLMNVALPDPVDLSSIVQGFCVECGFKPPLALPLVVLKLLGLGGDIASKLRPNFPLTSLNLRKLTTSTVVNTQRFEDTFPDLAQGAFQEYLSDSCEYYRRSH